MATEKGLILSEKCSEMICQKANWKVEQAHQIFKMVCDYHTLYNEGATLDEIFVQDVLSRLG